MVYAFAVNVAANLIIGLALLMAWWRDPLQRFARELGWAHLALVVGPPAYLAWLQPAPLPHLAGGAALLVATAAYSYLLAGGVSMLAQRPLSRRNRMLLLAGLLGVLGPLLWWDLIAAQAAASVIHTLVGLIALRWLWPQGRAARAAGVALVLLGLNFFTAIVLGEDQVALQATFGAVLRFTLGMAVLHMAMRRAVIAAERLRDQFMRLIDQSHQGVGVMQGEQVLYANPAVLRMYGAADLAEFNHRMRERTIPEADRAVARERHRRILSGELEYDEWEGERFRLDGAPLRLRFSAWRAIWNGEPAEQLVVTDETARHDAMRALLHQATHDPLTGLPNRSALQQQLRQLCDAATPFGLLLFDIDRFQLFNEAHGHALGDEVLKAMARALLDAFGSASATPMRLGEDEFALLLPGADEKDLLALVQQLRQRLQLPLEVPGQQFFVDVSVGLALHPRHGHDPDQLLRLADAAVHEAKRTPGTTVHMAEDRAERAPGITLQAEQALRAGIKNDEFVLRYQPKVDAHTHALVGFEALVRWQREGLGTISPADFVPAAERTGLITPLGKLILTQACQQLAEWRETLGRAVPVAVNVSPLQLLDRDFPELVERTLRHFNVPPSLLQLEITESAAVTHMDQAREQIGQLRTLGVEVALDDFGTGFSSLNMLRGLPLQTIKIDRSLIDPMPAPDAQAVVQAVCQLAAVLHLQVVAEGVERAEHAVAATAAGCGLLQGYWFAGPLEPADAARWLCAGAAPGAG